VALIEIHLAGGGIVLAATHVELGLDGIDFMLGAGHMHMATAR